MNIPTCILQEFVIQTYLWVLAGRLCGIMRFVGTKISQRAGNFKPRDFPQRRRKRNRECVLLVMLVCCV